MARQKASRRPHEADGTRPTYAQARRKDIQRIARTAVHFGANAVFAPTHFIDSMPNHWLAFDLEAAGDLREALNDLGGRAIAIYYPLVIAPKVMEYSAVGRRLRGSLQELEEQHGLDALWLRVSGFGSMDATARMLLRYVHFARAMHEAGVPVIAERSGTLGLALLAFGVVGGIEQGVTFGEGFDANTLTKDKGSSSGFMPAPRIYLAEIGAFVKKSEAERLFADRSAKNRFACQRPCCKRGVSDMIHDPRRHFLACRADEIGGISRVPTGMRADHYLTQRSKDGRQA